MPPYSNGGPAASDPVTSKPRRGHNAIPQLHNALEHNGPDKSHDGETAQSVQRGDEPKNQTNYRRYTTKGCW